MEGKQDAGNLIYKKNSGLNELLKLASPLPSPIYKQKMWLLASAAGFGGQGATHQGRGLCGLSKIWGCSQLLGGWE